MDNIKVNALMLRAVDYLENDKILTLLTAERGKLTAGIKGVKKAGAKLKFAAQPFCFAEYILAERGGRYTVTQASECESFYELRTDVLKFYAACAVCEAAIALTYEGDKNADIFSDCVRTLSTMCQSDEALTLIGFLLSVLRRSGYGISLDNCPVCGANLTVADKMRFNMDTGSFNCWDCGAGVGVSGVTYSVLRAADGHAGGEITIDGKKRALKLLKEYLAYKTDAKLNSLHEFINMI
ncbi:MAG: DNA repair protein RecO [Clostridiales bacterium]|nr:DNA repair protein RecO [Clostridiales bacterium]